MGCYLQIYFPTALIGVGLVILSVCNLVQGDDLCSNIDYTTDEITEIRVFCALLFHETEQPHELIPVINQFDEHVDQMNTNGRADVEHLHRFGKSFNPTDRHAQNYISNLYNQRLEDEFVKRIVRRQWSNVDHLPRFGKRLQITDRNPRNYNQEFDRRLDDLATQLAVSRRRNVDYLPRFGKRFQLPARDPRTYMY